MATIKFRIRGSSEDSPIYIRFSNGRKCNFEVRSGYFCNPSFFNNKTGKIRNIAEFSEKQNLQNGLNKLELDIRNTFNSVSTFDKNWLKRQVDIHHGRLNDSNRVTLVELFDMYIRHKTMSSEVTVTKSTLKSYSTSKNRIESFQTFMNKTYFIDEVGYDFKDEFIEWARSVSLYHSSTYSKTIKQIKTVCRYAKYKKRLQINDSIFERDVRSGKVINQVVDKFPFLNPDELNILSRMELPDYLSNARDWLLISCETACRISDLMKLTKKNIVRLVSAQEIIQYTQEKTGVTVDIPILPYTKEIIIERDAFPRPISHQRYNDYIKLVCKKAGLNEEMYGAKMNSDSKRKVFGLYPKFELVTSHIGRRSFATNHYGRLSNFSIMLVTGHKTESQFLEYIGKRNTDHINDFHKYYSEM